MVPSLSGGEGQGFIEAYVERGFCGEPGAQDQIGLLILTEDETGRDEIQEGDEDKEESDKTEGETQTVLVTQESECRSVWSYAVDRKGASEECFIHRICEVLKTVGLKEDRIIAKEDQELAIIDVAKEITRNRGGRFGTATVQLSERFKMSKGNAGH